MKKKVYQLVTLTTIILGLALSGCLKNDFNEMVTQNDSTQTQNSFSGFDFKTVRDQELTITVVNSVNQPVQGAVLDIYSQNPLQPNGQLRQDSQAHKIMRAMTNAEGILNCQFNTTTQLDSLFIITNYVGIPQAYNIKLSESSSFLTIGNQEAVNTKSAANLKNAQATTVVKVNGYYTLGTWNSSGVPDYLIAQDDNISNAFLNEVNASLPEYSRLPDSHPQYLANNADANLLVKEDCEVWVTFVHEGAGWRNMLGYYTYPVGSPPSTKADIRDLTVIFPNVSYLNSGGGLRAGNKVQLQYLDPETNEYTAIFPANTSIGWFVTAQGWQNQTITNGVYTHFSDIQFNVEANPELKKHNVLLYDEARELLLMGFEDIRRDQNSDEDFNDAVFYTTVTPFTAVNTSFYQPLDTPTDSDGDGVTDVFDEYPDDASKAFRNHYPGEGLFGTLVFEDLWPYKGDYDFNDLVVDYNFNQITDAQNLITGIQSKMVVKAIGASYHNAFGLSLNTPSENISNVSGQRFTQNFLDIASNGTENNQSKATIIYFDDAYNNLPYPGTGIGVNTSSDAPYVQPDTQQVTITFNTPLSFSQLGTPPYNPFIIIDGNRDVEVHLPNMAPTDLMNSALLGTGHDDSDPSVGNYFVSDVYLPWAINVPISFDYPAEKEAITQSHLMFSPWTVARGYNYMDWYHDKTGYRNNSKIYSK
ncbi:MAG: LruC domain-containing protein [Marinilabiliaceae bacterium]|nr:LruC domain-containing protein [Marinilabiliaceae bacterium]